MKNEWINMVLNGQLTKAVCWTLVHSLWVALIASALGMLIQLLGNGLSARIRYRLLCATLLVFVLLTGTMCYHQFNIKNEGGVSTISAIRGMITSTNVNNAQHAGNSLANQIIVFLNRQSGILVALWLLCLLVKSVRLAGGLWHIGRVRSGGSAVTSSPLNIRFDHLRQSLGIKTVVALKESAKVVVPFTVGILRPVVLLPAGLVLQLTPGQLDSILLHELAHIARRDYLTGLLQSLLETIFFFNPGLLWLSAQIREERENCCDDIALKRVKVKSDYLSVLLSFAGTTQTLTMPLTGKGKNGLKKRLNRLIGVPAKPVNLLTTLLPVLALLLISAFTLQPKHQDRGGKTIQPASQSMPRLNLTNDTVPVKTKLNDPKARRQRTHADTVAKIRSLALPRIAESRQPTDDRQRFRMAIAALVGDKIISDADGVNWFALTENELIVNGQRQSDALQEKLRTQLRIKRNYGLFYGPVQVTGTGVFMDKGDL